MGPILSPSWARLGPVLGPSWGHVGPCWALLGPSWAILGSSWAILAPLGTILGHIGALFAYSPKLKTLRSCDSGPSASSFNLRLCGHYPCFLPSCGPVLAIFAWAASVMYPHASSLFLRSWAMWSLSLAALTRPGGMREAIE